MTEEERRQRNQAVKAASGHDGLPQLHSHVRAVLAEQVARRDGSSHGSIGGSISPAASSRLPKGWPTTFRDVALCLIWVAGLVALGFAASILIHSLAGLAIVALAAPTLWKHLPEALKSLVSG